MKENVYQVHICKKDGAVISENLSAAGELDACNKCEERVEELIADRFNKYQVSARKEAEEFLRVELYNGDNLIFGWDLEQQFKVMKEYLDSCNIT